MALRFRNTSGGEDLGWADRDGSMFGKKEAEGMNIQRSKTFN